MNNSNQGFPKNLTHISTKQGRFHFTVNIDNYTYFSPPLPDFKPLNSGCWTGTSMGTTTCNPIMPGQANVISKRAEEILTLF